MGSRTPVKHLDVQIGAGGIVLAGDLAIPTSAGGIVIFAHGSGSSRHSPRNRLVADRLNKAGLATLLFDLLSTNEEAIDQLSGRLRFDIELLAQRLTDTVDWVRRASGTHRLRIGLFGASTGAAAALVTAAQRPEIVEAVVSRGGRPDLAGPFLGQVAAPTLLIVGGLDRTVIDLNRQAQDQLRAESQITIVPGATHLFEEPGKLDEVAGLACDWFTQHLEQVPPQGQGV